QCLMSSFLGGHSGNRGACAQPCRQPYTLVRDGKEVMKQEAYVLSLKDLKALDYIDDLLDAGVTSFKIEGRMKGDT
ncbi:U32 family peptidase, partial [Phascolarctobacterium faecium]|uniref:peptidase U32 family protein n=1 Tax=Phascolarctobacterium faecium TaxID=33025 RepID=UPI001D0688D5